MAPRPPRPRPLPRLLRCALIPGCAWPAAFVSRARLPLLHRLALVADCELVLCNINRHHLLHTPPPSAAQQRAFLHVFDEGWGQAQEMVKVK